MKIEQNKSHTFDDDLFVQGKKAIVIVAHPDDETIWMGGTILMNKELDWTIFSLCRKSDDDRRPKFKKVCDYYGAKCIITDLDDEGKISFEQGVLDIKKYIINELKGESFDFIFTHGENGEYRHNAHIQVYQSVKELVETEEIKTKFLIHFNYEKDEEHDHKVKAKTDSNYIKIIDPKIFLEKKRITSEMHGYPMDGIDVGYSTNPEAFLVKSIKN